MREQGEETFVHKDGHFYPVAFTASPIRQEGRTVGTIIEVRDITDEVRVARRLAFLAALGQALQPLTDPDQVVATAARLLGEHLQADRCAYAEVEADEDHFVLTGDYTRGDTASIVGRYAMSAFGAEALRLMRRDLPYTVEDVAADLRVPEADIAAYEQTQIRAVICMPLHKAGRFVAAMAVHQRTPRRWLPEDVELLRTVTQRCWESIERARALRSLQESERRLRAALAEAEGARAEAERANRAKSEFLAVMSHELRTPLNAIGGYAELMQMGIRGPVTEQQHDDLRRIQASQRHLLGLINEVLNYARLETGSVRYDVSDVNLGEALAAAEALVAPQAGAKDLSLSVTRCPPRLSARADAEKVRQILVNLLSNAVKFTGPGGRVELACESAGSDVHVLVRDTGIGIAADQMDRIFEPFVQVRADLARTAEGTGLGLAISRDLARGMGGDLAAESTPGVGSTFTLTLPAAE